MEWKPGYVNKQASLMQMYYKSCVHSRTIKVHELLCCSNGYAMRIEGKKFEFEDTIVWVFVMHSSVEMVTKRLYLQIGARKKAHFFSLMYFCESLCINRISHNYFIPQLVFCIIMPFRTSFHIPFRKLIPPFTLTETGGLLTKILVLFYFWIFFQFSVCLLKGPFMERGGNN